MAASSDFTGYGGFGQWGQPTSSIAYNNNRGVGFGYNFGDGNSSFYYPSYNYNAAEQNALRNIAEARQAHGASGQGGKPGFNIDNAVDYLNEHAYPKYDKATCGKCAKAVRLSLLFGICRKLAEAGQDMSSAPPSRGFVIPKKTKNFCASKHYKKTFRLGGFSFEFYPKTEMITSNTITILMVIFTAFNLQRAELQQPFGK